MGRGFLNSKSNLEMECFFCADDGGGMNPEGLRKCMSLGYSTKKSNTTIGQCNHNDLLVSLAASLV